MRNHLQNHFFSLLNQDISFWASDLRELPSSKLSGVKRQYEPRSETIQFLVHQRFRFSSLKVLHHWFRFSPLKVYIPQFFEITGNFFWVSPLFFLHPSRLRRASGWHGLQSRRCRRAGAADRSGHGAGQRQRRDLSQVLQEKLEGDGYESKPWYPSVHPK